MVNTQRRRTRAILTVAGLAAFAAFAIIRLNAADSPSSHPLRLRSGDRYLTAVESESFLKSTSAVRGGVIQFESTPTATERDALSALGVVLGRYIPDNAFIASIPGNIGTAQLAAHGVKWTTGLAVADKLPDVLSESGTTPAWCVDSKGIPRFSIGVFPHVDLKEAESWMATQYGATALGASKLGHSIEVALPADNWQEIAADDRVLWVEPFWPRVITNNSNRVNTNAEAAQAVPYSLSGNNIVVGEWDEGRADPSHADFGGRVISADASAISSHGTHVGGSVMGAGASPSFTYRGMAPSAILLTHQWWNTASEMEFEYDNAILNVDMSIATNSWVVGFGPPSVPTCNSFLGNYFAECANLDDVARGDLGKPVTIVWAAGNERLTSSSYCGSVGFTFGSIPPYGTSKNVLTIGAINSNNSTMTSFSSWGPTDDGRLKPELVAPGCQTNLDFGVTSTKPVSGYSVACGTSMAAPTTAGCIALWMQRWNLTQPTIPFASTIKAVFVESAADLGDPGPEYDWGYGRLDVTAAVDLINENRVLQDSIAHGETKSWTFENNGSLTLASVTLAWDDPGAAENAAVTLINNLNLRLIPPTGPAEYLPWVLNPASPATSATNGINVRDNLEQVRRTGAIEVGTWTVEVTGANVPTGPQRFSLAYSPGISLTSTNQAYAVGIVAASDQASMSGVVALPFTLSNEGFTNDTYDVTLTSSHGWVISGNPLVKAVDAHSDSSLSFDLTIPPATPYGTIDTIIALAESQGSLVTTDVDTMLVTVVSGRAVAVLAGADSTGVIGRTVAMSARLTNTGFATDSLSWTAVSPLGWTVTPSSGVAEIVNGGFVDLAFDVTIDPLATPGVASAIVVAGASEDDPAAADADTSYLLALDRPPVPVSVEPADLELLNTNTPTLRWTHNAYTVPPAGWDVFSYYVDIADDAGISVNAQRFGPLSDTSVVTPLLNDGDHFWRIVTYNPLGDSSLYSTVQQFTLDTQAPQAPALDQPPDSLYEADTTLTFSWQTVVGADQYRFEIASDPNFTADVDSVWTASLSHDRILAACSTVVYWRVSARDAAGNISVPSMPHRYAVYMVGDINFDCVLDIVDVVGIVGAAFRGEELPVPPGRAEIVCAPPLDITDVVRLIDIIFRGGLPPCGPT